MNPITQAGQSNPTALLVPGLFVQIAPPANVLINGVPTNVLGLVGTATDGPVNTPVIVGDPKTQIAVFGPVQPRKFDLGTVLSVAYLQGANNFRCVRVTDGTDTAASATITATGTALTLAALYTGSNGNNISYTLAKGSAANTFALIISKPGVPSERFDNLAGSGNAFWVNAANAINNGQNGLRGASKIVVATAGAGTGAPTLGTASLSGGTDGAATITSAVLVGADGTTRSGMYALRGQGCSVGVLADADDSTQWTYQSAFGLSEGIYMIMTGPSGDSIANAVSTKATAGIDSYAAKMCFGDWVLWSDQANGVSRYVAPSGFFAGMISNLAPNQSSSNKPMQGIIGTQKSANGTYSAADLQALAAAGIDVIANPSEGGTFFGAKLGHNSSSNVVIHGDNYTRMTNYIASTLNNGLGQFIGQANTPTLRANAKAAADNYFVNLVANKILTNNDDGSDPFKTQCDANNNPQSSRALGYLYMYIRVTYQSIVEEFVTTLEGGQSVVTTRVSTQPALQ